MTRSIGLYRLPRVLLAIGIVFLAGCTDLVIPDIGGDQFNATVDGAQFPVEDVNVDGDVVAAWYEGTSGVEDDRGIVITMDGVSEAGTYSYSSGGAWRASYFGDDTYADTFFPAVSGTLTVTETGGQWAGSVSFTGQNTAGESVTVQANFDVSD